MKQLLIIAAMICSVMAHAQTSSQVRVVETLGDLIKRSPVAGEAVSVLGRFVPGDWGPARLMYATNSMFGGATNRAHSFASKATNMWWVSADATAPKQDVRWWGAKGDGTDDSDAIQAAIDYSGVHWKALHLNPGVVYGLAKPLRFETGLDDGDDYFAFRIEGNFATLKVLAPTNAIKIEGKTVYTGLMQDLFITYDKVYTSTNAVAVSYEGRNGGGPAYNNLYNIAHRNITVFRGYYGFKQQEWCSIWGSSWENTFFGEEMTGGAMKLSTVSAFGNPNNRILNSNARADLMTQPVYELNQQSGTVLKNIEVNVISNVPAIYISASYNSRIESSRIEVGWYSQDYTGPIFTANNAHFKVDGFEVQSTVWNMPQWGFVVRDVAGPPWTADGQMILEGISFRSCQKLTNNYVAVVASDYRRVQVGRIGFQYTSPVTNELTFPTLIPFVSSASLTNVGGLNTVYRTNEAPIGRGFFAFDSANRMYYSDWYGTGAWKKIDTGAAYGPAAVTSGAVPRWDGTDGKLMKNSALLVDDSGSITAPGQSHVFGPGYGNPIIVLNGQKGEGGAVSGVRAIDYQSAGSLRWRLGANSTTETNINNSGSEFELQAFSTNGTYLYTVFRALRDTGRLETHGDIQLGGVASTNRPRLGFTTGTPEGVHADPPGSARFDVNGALWLKLSGFGNTGWVLMPTVAGGGGPTNGTAVSVNNGGALSLLNLQSSTGIPMSIAGSNAYVSIADRDWGDITSSSAGLTWTLDNGVVDTNKISAGFYAWVDSKGTGNGITADGVATTNLQSSAGIRLDTSGGQTSITISNTPVTPGTYTLASVTVGQDGRITAASSGVPSTNSGTVVSVQGVQQSSLNITNSPEIEGTLVGTNLSLAVVLSSIDTNKITAIFRSWIESMALGPEDNGTLPTNRIDATFHGLLTRPDFFATSNNTLTGSLTISNGGAGVLATRVNGGTATNMDSVAIGPRSSTGTRSNAMAVLGGVASANNQLAVGGEVAATRVVTSADADIGTSAEIGTSGVISDGRQQFGTGANAGSGSPSTFAVYGSATNNDAVAIGRSATTATWTNAMALGVGASNTAANQIRIGPGITVSVPGAVEIGSTSVVSHLAGKQPIDADLTVIAGLTFAQGDLLMYRNGSLTNLGRGTNGQVLATVVSGSDTNLVWTNAPTGTGGGSVTNLNDLADVDAASPATNSFFVWNGTAWVPTNITVLEVTELIASNIVDAPLTGVPTVNGSNLWDQIELKAPKASPALTGDPTGPTATAGDNDTSLATTAFVEAAVRRLETNWVAEQTIAQFSAIEFQPEVTDPATFGKRNGIGVMTYDPSVQQQACVVFPVPYGYTNTTMKVILHWCSSATSGNARWGAQFDKLTGVDIDSLSFATAVEATTATSGTAGLISTTTLDSVGLDSAAMGNFVALRVYRDTGDAADNMDSNTLELIGVEVRAK